MPFHTIPGTTPLVLVAPHGGQRDVPMPPERARKVNDLYTAALTEEVARRTGAAGLVNATLDRNAVDLNRIGAAHDRAPEFLSALQALLDATHARHGRATVVTIHGWNVVRPAVDVGLGCRPGPDPLAVDTSAAVSAEFAAGPLRALLDAFGAAGIRATIGARYPAAGRENLLQLFTPRHRDDPRPLVRRLAALGDRTDAVQLELGIPLRWPGPWRGRLVDALARAAPRLAGLVPPPAAPAWIAPDVAAAETRTLEFVSPGLAGVARVDAAGGRLLLLPSGGGLALLTSEPASGRGLEMSWDAPRRIRFEGPLLRFPDTEPFLDLEHGLARADVVEAALDVTMTGSPGLDSGVVQGTAALAGTRVVVDGHGFARSGGTGPARLRTALRLGRTRTLTLAIAADGRATGTIEDGAGRVAVRSAEVRLGPREAPLDGLHFDALLEDGGRVRVHATPGQVIPVIRRWSGPPMQVLLATLLVGDEAEPAGWLELVQPLAPSP